MAEKTGGSSIGVTGLLGVSFVVLKLCHVIDWSWWLVLAPFWLPAAIFASVLLTVAFVAGCAAYLAGRKG